MELVDLLIFWFMLELKEKEALVIAHYYLCWICFWFEDTFDYIILFSLWPMMRQFCPYHLRYSLMWQTFAFSEAFLLFFVFFLLFEVFSVLALLFLSLKTNLTAYCIDAFIELLFAGIFVLVVCFVWKCITVAVNRCWM